MVMDFACQHDGGILVAIAFVAASSSNLSRKVTLVLRLFEFVQYQKSGAKLAESLVGDSSLSSLESLWPKYLRLQLNMNPSRQYRRQSYPSKPCFVPFFDEFVQLADYSLMDTLNADPDATGDGDDHRPRQVSVISYL